jgi:three-Cys-motif partner protein
MTQHRFGGNWTMEKLERVRKYLEAYMEIMKLQPFRVAYIDAFAGTGYVRLESKSRAQASLLQDVGEEEVAFIEGSARIALQISHPFDRYIFVERRPTRAAQLESLKEEFSHLADRIKVVSADANGFIMDLCAKDWRKRRAVMFLDPYGMQVSWGAIAAIARTAAIDLWILFPLGVAVNRLVRRDGKISEPVRRRLDTMFGASDWFCEFYKPSEKRGLFDDEEGLQKVANFDSISEYFVRRLKTIFPFVADNPLPLLNSCNNPLYLLCFAAGNSKGGPTAVRIAQDILRRR